MSWLPYNDNPYAQPRLCFSPPFPGSPSFYEGATYSVVPVYAYGGVHFPGPVLYSPVPRHAINPFASLSSTTPIAFNHGKREYCSLCGSTPPPPPPAAAAVNASIIPDVENLPRRCDRSAPEESPLMLLAPSDQSDANTMESSGSRVEGGSRSRILNAPHVFELSKNMSPSSQLNASELKARDRNLPSCISSLDANLGAACKESEKFSAALEDASETDIINFENFRRNQEGESETWFSDVDDDSQLEYHSAEEQDYVDDSYSSGQQKGDLDLLQSKLEYEGWPVSGQKHFDKLEDESSNLVCHKSNEISESPTIFQDNKCCSEGKGLNLEAQERQEGTSGMFYSILSEDSYNINMDKREMSIQNSLPKTRSKIDIHEKLEKVTVSLTNEVLTSEMATNNGLCKQTDYRNRSVLQESGNECVLQQEKPLAWITGAELEASDSCVREQAVLPPFNSNKVKCCFKSCDHPSRCQEHFQSAINQAIDASSDFRALFTTSRATNVKTSVVSRAQNTVITMMNKGRPKEWLSESHRSVACNTDWSCVHSDADVTASSHNPVADIWGPCVTSDASKGDWKSESEDPLELKNNVSRNCEEIPNRMVHLSHEMASHLPNCCKKTLQRAMKAEIQFLRTRYEMYHQQCWQTCKPLLEGKECVFSSTPGAEMSAFPLLEDTEVSSPPSRSVSENRIPQPCPSHKEERSNSNSFAENSVFSAQDVSDNWFDAKENLTVNDSSESFTANEKAPFKRVSRPEKIQIVKAASKETKKFYYIHVVGLSPSVTEDDLWLRFQKYHVSEISMCESSDENRYASLSFKEACDAKLAVKAMDAREIKGKVVKVRLVKTIKDRHLDHESIEKQIWESQREVLCSDEKNVKCGGKSSHDTFEASALTTAQVSAAARAKRLDLLKGSLKKPAPAVTAANYSSPGSASSKVPFGDLAPSKIPSPDIKSSKSASKDAPFNIQEDVTADISQLTSVKVAPNSTTAFVPPNTLTLRNFRRVVHSLEELHPGVSRETILKALVETKETKGGLSGSPLSAVVQMTSALLNKKYAVGNAMKKQ